MFYTYVQNNSAGYWEGPQYVIVEALTAEDADIDAVVYMGVYFDGVDAGRDCECCGDRWERARDKDGDTEPCLYHMPIHQAARRYLVGDEAVIRYRDGTVVRLEGLKAKSEQGVA